MTGSAIALAVVVVVVALGAVAIALFTVAEHGLPPTADLTITEEATEVTS